MSWYAHLGDYEFNYTHNTNKMIEWVLGDAIAATRQPWWSKLAEGDTPLGSGSWWDLLDGKTGADSEPLLSGIVEGLMSDPNKFRAMNPENGWGSYDQLMGILMEMKRAAYEFPDEIWVTGG